MKTLLAAIAAIAVTSGAAMAAPGPSHARFAPHKVTHAEQMAINKARSDLNRVQFQARKDGRVSAYERIQIRLAQGRLDRVIAQAHRT